MRVPAKLNHTNFIYRSSILLDDYTYYSRNEYDWLSDYHGHSFLIEKDKKNKIKHISHVRFYSYTDVWLLALKVFW